MHASHRLKRLLTFIGIRFCVASLLWSGVAYSSDVPGNFSVCFDFSCKTSQLVQLSRQDWYQVEGLFYLNANAKEERIRLREAVAIMEQIVGTYTPTFQDVALNWPSDSADARSSASFRGSYRLRRYRVRFHGGDAVWNTSVCHIKRNGGPDNRCRRIFIVINDGNNGFYLNRNITGGGRSIPVNPS